MSAKKSPAAKGMPKAAGSSPPQAGGRSKPARQAGAANDQPRAANDRAGAAKKPATAKATASKPGEPAATPRVRLQRALAAAGFGSRRQCEELIVEGRVEVDGQIVDQLGATIDWSTSKVFVDGTPLKPRRLVYYAVNKPTGVVTTNSDPEGRPRVIDLVPPEERVFPVGRLDRSSEGLILLTNDGDLAQHLAHPRYEIQKVYRVTVAGNVQAETIRQMQQGIYIAEGLVRVEGARVLKARPRATEMEITLKEGKNREIRRILARLGHKVQTLKRIAIGSLRLGEMPTGAYRRLSAEEIKKLKQTTQAAGRSAEESSPGRRPRPAAGGRKRPPATSAGKPPAAAKATSASRSRPAAGSRPTAAGRPTKAGPVAPLALPKLSGARTGSVIGADPAKAKDAAPRSKSHIIQPRPTRQASGGKTAEKSGGKTDGKRAEAKRAGQGRSGKPPTGGPAGKKTTSRSAPLDKPRPGGKPRPGARRKKGS